ncbi:hypothetical protein LB545_26435 [Mesorhizobium sp. BR1-1-6]|uniref:hypothetical protein n=1 Tax=unclassified Mesorhizobium TaxID=325217 RepID=UPI00112BA3FA|nr:MULTISPECIES: hypothetical protein [unclassified Mesorhizobium]MBZ9897862.1 hypothetical protein [Mesorhizobium sp. BR1-1-6]MCA0059224.1 hypothetical protein [Mesorhizobium sp. B261B1A]TPK39494.1 hypothetical protein FJ867_05775 [Mesorhizobium sp. B2-5-3]TPL07778.1 hypothetical protein FJ944_19845 [Mesorhizobium sp. B2-4-11]
MASDRIARAGDYVLGLMNDAERERAERDLEVDPAFRDAVVQLAERMHIFDRAESAGGAERWRQITQRIGDLPQMRAVGLEDAKPVIRGPAKPHDFGFFSLGGRRGLAVAIGLVVAFALGYLAGKL